MPETVTALSVTPDGAATFTTLPAGAPARLLAVLRHLVGGDIEALPIPLDSGVTAYGNENAKALGLAVNHPADVVVTLLGWQRYPGDFLSGTVVFIGARHSGGEDGWVETDVPAFVIDAARTAGLTLTGDAPDREGSS